MCLAKIKIITIQKILYKYIQLYKDEKGWFNFLFFMNVN